MRLFASWNDTPINEKTTNPFLGYCAIRRCFKKLATSSFHTCIESNKHFTFGVVVRINSPFTTSLKNVPHTMTTYLVSSPVWRKVKVCVFHSLSYGPKCCRSGWRSCRGFGAEGPIPFSHVGTFLRWNGLPRELIFCSPVEVVLLYLYFIVVCRWFLFALFYLHSAFCWNNVKSTVFFAVWSILWRLGWLWTSGCRILNLNGLLWLDYLHSSRELQT